VTTTRTEVTNEPENDTHCRSGVSSRRSRTETPALFLISSKDCVMEAMQAKERWCSRQSAGSGVGRTTTTGSRPGPTLWRIPRQCRDLVCCALNAGSTSSNDCRTVSIEARGGA
jgi:hypothetical protein